MPGETPLTHRPERRFWPLSDEREALGRGKLRVYFHFCSNKVNSAHQICHVLHLRLRQLKRQSMQLLSLRNLLERRGVGIEDLAIAMKTILTIDMNVNITDPEAAWVQISSIARQLSRPRLGTCTSRLTDSKHTVLRLLSKITFSRNKHRK